MNTPLSDERLAEIREREQAATEGPWVRWTDQENIPGWDGFIVVGDDAPEGEECNPAARVYIESDAEFIAHARQDVPVLLAEVERLRAELARRIEAEAEALADQTMLKELSVKDGALTLEAIPPHEIVATWVHAARAMLGDAPNYSETEISMPADSGVSMEFTQAGDYETYVFTVQRKGRMTPHQARLAAEKRAEQAEAELERLRAELAGSPS